MAHPGSLSSAWEAIAQAKPQRWRHIAGLSIWRIRADEWRTREAICLTRFDGAVWNDRPVSPDMYTSERPVFAFWGEGAEQKLVVVCVGNGGDETIYYSTVDGYTWTPKQSIGGKTDSAPSVIKYRGHLYACWKEAGNDESIMYSTFDGTAWSLPKSLPGQFAVGAGPSLAVFNEQLYLVWRGWDTKLWWARTLPTSASGTGGVMAGMAAMNLLHSTGMTAPIQSPFQAEPTIPQPAIPVQAEQSIDVQSKPALSFQLEQPAPVQSKPTLPIQSEQKIPFQSGPALPVQSGQAMPLQSEPGIPEVATGPSAPPVPRPSSSSSSSSADLRRIKRGIKKGFKKGISGLSDKFHTKFGGK